MTNVVRLGHVADVVSGVGFPKDMQGQAEGEVPVFKVGDISNAVKSGTRHLRRSPNHLTREAAIGLSKTLMPPGTTVFAKIGEGLKLNRRGILAQPSLVDNNVMGLIPKADVVSPDYLYYFMQTVDLGELSQATAIPSVRKSDVVEIRIPLRAIGEQDRIVAEIEKQFSRLDEAVAGLKRVKANLKRYKAAVLKSAVTGRLIPTEADLARREGRNYETGAQLLQRILETRRSQWQGKGKYKEPAAPDTTDLPELPEGWVWATYDAVGRLQLGRQRAPKYHDGPNMRPYLRVQNVFEDRIDLSDVMTMTFPPNDFEKFRLYPGDLLLNEGQSPELLGRPAIYRGELPNACFTNTLIRFRALDGLVVEFALLLSRHNMHAARFVDEGTITTNIAHLSLGRLATVEFPLPPLPEQHRIVAEVDRLLSIAREAEAEVEANLKRAQELRQAILSAAFSNRNAIT